MEIRFACHNCGQHLAISSRVAGKQVSCPACGESLTVPKAVDHVVPPPIAAPIESSAPTSQEPPPAAAPATELKNHPAVASGSVTCPVCWLAFDPGDVLHVATHDSLRGDPVLGEDAPQRFTATRFNDLGQAIDAMGIPCLDIACPHCRRKFPPGFLNVPYHIISLVGDQSAGKSYYLSVLSKVFPASLITHFGITCQDADPAGNAPLNRLRNLLFSAQSPEQAFLEKTQMIGGMYERLPRQGRMVMLPRPFVYSLTPRGKATEMCSVIFYDNAGEHFQPGYDLVEHPGAQHVASADGIMFLFDPFNSPEFRRKMSGTPDPQMEKRAVDQQDVILTEMRTRIQKLHNLRSGAKIRTPIAVLVGKCDAWIHLLPDGALERPLNGAGMSFQHVAGNSKRIRDFLFSVCPTVVSNAEALSDNVMFFAVSAFGHTPIKVEIDNKPVYVPDPMRLDPTQVEIPPLWLLSQFASRLFAATQANS